jgi:type IV pilus assembly protein PilA
MLNRLTKATKERDKGFTLIELLVVIIIIGILAAIAIPIFLNQRKKGIDASVKSDVKQLATQVETYFTDNQAYPASVTTDTGGKTMTVGTEKVTLSKNNVLTYSIASGVYTICGSNTNGTADGTSKWVKYVSNSGGLQSDLATSCP